MMKRSRSARRRKSIYIVAYPFGGSTRETYGFGVSILRSGQASISLLAVVFWVEFKMAVEEKEQISQAMAAAFACF
jgi:hypothetical protein